VPETAAVTRVMVADFPPLPPRPPSPPAPPRP
jgi:hypothetical protein